MEVGVGNSPETGGVAMEFMVFDGAELSSPPTVPPRIRRRLTETKSSSSPSSVEEIEAKLRNADLRRQKFYESLSSKARLKRRSPQSANEHNLGQRLEAKRQAAEQKRMQILKAHSQRRATLREKTSQSLLRRIGLQSKYKEHVHAAIYQKRATAEKNRLELLGADREKTHARRLQGRKVAKSVSQQQETENMKLSESLEDKLQRAKRQRAAYLMQVSLHSFVGVDWNKKTQKQADQLSRNLLRCWRKFLKQRTTLDLAKSYHDLNINASHGGSIPFENFAILIETSSTLRTTKALLDRLETRYRVLLGVTSGTNSYGQEDIDHLLTRVILPNGATPRSPVHSRYVKKAATKAPVKLSRYQVRVVLSAYMILGHPNAVFSGQGVRETALAKSAKNFVQEFELLIDIILNGPSQRSSEESNPALARCCPFRSQLAAFDAAWCSYLNSFVVWKVKDVESLEKDLVRAACQMEISMMQKYKPTPEGDDNALAHDVKAFQKQMQVTEHQKLLREKVMHLSGEAGIERMQNALSDTRREYLQSKEYGSPVESPVAHIPSHSTPTSPPIAGPDERSDSVVRSLSNDGMPPLEDLGSSGASNSGLVNHSGEMLGMENVFIVNEFLHGRHYSLADSLNMTDENQKVREIMEKAFWDGISDSIQQEKHDHIVVLMKEVRDELYEMSPKSWKQKIIEVIDLDILSQLLSSHRLDMEYLGMIMEFALVSLQKLSAVAHENQLKESHQKVVLELAELCQAGDGSNRTHAIALVKGLRFVLEQIQVLKQEISKARIRILEPLLKGPTGLEYLGKAFAKLYGPPSDALNRLPMTIQWLSSVVPGKDQEWIEHKRAISELQEGLSSERPVIPSTALRTGGSFSSSRLQTSASMNVTDIAGIDNQYPECKGEKGDLLVRLGLVKLVNNVNGVTQEELPETLKLNFLRLRAVQAQLQKITVIATSILVLRQTLVMEQMISSFEDMESTIVRCSLQLSGILDTVVDAGLEQIVQLLSKTAEGLDKSNDSAKNQSRRVVMARTLRKSLQGVDPVFVRVSRAVYLATRGVVLAGSGTHGRGLVEKSLRQVGAAILTDKVVAQGAVLGVMSRVSENVHGLWFARLIQNM